MLYDRFTQNDKSIRKFLFPKTCHPDERFSQAQRRNVRKDLGLIISMID